MTAAVLALAACLSGLYLAIKALTLIAERDEAKRDRDFYNRPWINESHDHHAVVMKLLERSPHREGGST